MKRFEQTQFIHASMYGSYYVDCDIIEQTNDHRTKISFIDPNTEERCERIIDNELLRTPGSIGKAADS